MNATVACAKSTKQSFARGRLLGLAALVLVGGALGWWWKERRDAAAPAAAAAPTEAKAEPDDPTKIEFSAARQAAAGVKLAEVAASEMTETVAVTGKLAVNEDRLAHIYSFVEGVLREAKVRLGQEVKEGDLLAVVDSKEVGQAKLDLAKERLNVNFAKVNHQWAATIHENTQALIGSLLKKPEVNDVEKQFQDAPMGDNRQLLVSAYAKFHLAEADYLRLKALREQNVGVEKDFLRAKAEHEAASATYQALLEQLKFTTKQRLLEADQKLQEALTAERMSRAVLLILGYTEAELAKLDPLSEGEAVAHYPIRAPFDGTIIDKHAVLSEFVGQQHQLFALTDLSKLRIHADVFEKDIAALTHLKGKTLRFRTAGYPGREFTAELFHTGDSVDEKTRAVTLIASADNAERLLKPGMFVEVLLPIAGSARSVQIPTSALQRQNDETYVFVASGDEAFERRSIRIGRTIAGSTEVIAGLEPKERVVVEGAFALKSEMLRDLLAE